MPRQVTLIVEDGTIVPNSNSFVDENTIVSYAASRGVTLPVATDADMDKVAVLGIKAMDFLFALNWRGEVVSPLQTTPWPRKNTNTPTPENIVPGPVQSAQLQLTLLSQGGVILLPSHSGAGYLTEQRIGPIVERYSEKVGISHNGLPLLPGVMALLDPWIIGDFSDMVPVLIKSVGERRGH